MSKLTKNMDIVLQQGPDLIEFYRNNPCIAAYELLGVDLAPVQRVVFEAMWFKPYILSIATRGFGKSKNINELAHIGNLGLVYLYEFLPKIPEYLLDGGDEVIDWCNNIYTSEGFRNTNKVALEKGIIGKKITTQNMYTTSGSDKHPMLTMDQYGNLIYRRVDDFKVGDRICIQRNQNVFGNNSIDIDEAYLIGLFIGDGCITSHATITSEDEYILSFIAQYYISKGIGWNIYYKSGSCTCDIALYKEPADIFFNAYNIDRVTSYNKSVPYSIRTATRESQIAFLQGYFDTDGTVHNTNGGVSCCSVSKKLLTEIQMMLLNFGIISRLRKKKTNSTFGKAYLLDMFSEDAYKFKEFIGFRLVRKQAILDQYFSNKKCNINKDTIPYVLHMCYNITKYYHTTYTTSKKPSFSICTGNKKEITYGRLHRFITQCNYVEASGFSLSAVSKDIKLLKELLKYNYYFDTITSIEDWKGDCYDFEMDMGSDVEPNYMTNGFINHNTFLSGTLSALLALLYPGYRVGLIGPSFRQAKMIFAEVEKLYTNAPILRAATEKRPIRGSDTCYLKFKSSSGYNGAFIEALPLGVDGAKIRGSRFYCVIIDEFAQVPSKIIETVLAPMSITKLDPMKKVRELERRRVLIEAGLASEGDFEEDSINKMIGTSSGYYKFNHMYKRMREYWNQIEQGSQDHAVFQIPYTALPDGFLDPKNIENAERVMSSHEFAMEYLAAMVSDSEGFFKASVLDKCTTTDFVLELSGDKESNYIIGIDPNQGGKAKCGVVIIKLGKPNKIVRVMALDGKTTQDITTSLQDLCNIYNVTRIFMDRGGGGKAVSDLLAEGYNGVDPILNRNDKETLQTKGRRILDLVTPSTSWISDANFSTLSLFEDSNLMFPQEPLNAVEEKSQEVFYSNYALIEELKRQCLNIVVTQTTGGSLHFDTPKKGQNKDLYSALVLAGYGVKALEHELLDDTSTSSIHVTGGLVRGRSQGAWSNISSSTSSSVFLSKAVLKKKLK
jgi:intein/homing endonuclease